MTKGIIRKILTAYKERTLCHESGHVVAQAPRQAVESPSLETGRAKLGKGLSNLVWLRYKPWLEQRKVWMTSIGPF